MKAEHITVLEALVETDRCTRAELEAFTEEEQAILAQSALEYVESGESLTIKEIEAHDYKFQMPDIEAFVMDPHYLGSELGFPLDEEGQPDKAEERQIYTFWMEHLHEIYVNSPGKYHEILVTGAIGGGKTTFANIICAYDFLELMSLKAPQRHFGLMPSTRIVFAFFNILKDLAEDVGYAQFHNMLSTSPAFNDNMVYNSRLKEGFRLQPPTGLGFKVGSRVTHTLGQAVFAAQIDEANFGTDTQDKKRDEKKSQVYDNYTSLLRRKESRFLDLPGHFVMCSSKRSDADFLEKHIDDSKGKAGIYVIDAAQWEFKACRRDLYSGITFKVLKGDITRDPRLLFEGEQVKEELSEMVIDVPVEHKAAFDTNIIDALREIAGVSSQPKFAFFGNRELVRKMVDTKRKSPFRYTSRGKVIPNTLNISFFGDDQIGDYLIHDNLFCDNGHLPYRNQTRYLGFDTGYAGDAAGISMVCKAGVKIMKKPDPKTGKNTMFFIPKYYADFFIRIKGKGKDHFPLAKLTTFVKYVKTTLGINVGGVSTDGYQSVQMQQDLKIAFPGMEVVELSVDRTDAHHINFRNLVYAQALEGIYQDKNIMVELFDLQHIKINQRVTQLNILRMRVDHPTVGSDKFVGRKDVTDSLVGGLGLCKELDTSVSTDEIKAQIEESKGIDIDALVKAAEVSADEELKKIDDLKLDELFTGQKST